MISLSVVYSAIEEGYLYKIDNYNLHFGYAIYKYARDIGNQGLMEMMGSYSWGFKSIDKQLELLQE